MRRHSVLPFTKVKFPFLFPMFHLQTSARILLLDTRRRVRFAHWCRVHSIAGLKQRISAVIAAF